MTSDCGVAGSAVNGIDYPPLLGYIIIPAGQSSVKLPLSPNPDVQNEGTDTVTLTLTPGNGYAVGTQITGTARWRARPPATPPMTGSWLSR